MRKQPELNIRSAVGNTVRLVGYSQVLEARMTKVKYGILV